MDDVYNGNSRGSRPMGSFDIYTGSFDQPYFGAMMCNVFYIST